MSSYKHSKFKVGGSFSINENVRKYFEFNDLRLYESNFFKKIHSLQFIDDHNEKFEIIILEYKCLGFSICWCPAFFTPEGNEKKILKILKNKFFSATSILILRDLRKFNTTIINGFHESGFEKLSLSSGQFTMILDLKNTNKNLSFKPDRRWKKTVKNLGLENFEFCENIIQKDIFDLIKELIAEKKLTKKHFPSWHYISKLFKYYPKSFVVVGVKRKSDKKLLSIRGVLTEGNIAVDLLAASVPNAAGSGTSYILFEKIIEKLNSRNIVHYDLNGVDYLNNPGVYLFKKRTGARFIVYNGVFIICKSKLLLKLSKIILSLIK